MLSYLCYLYKHCVWVCVCIQFLRRLFDILYLNSCSYTHIFKTNLANLAESLMKHPLPTLPVVSYVIISCPLPLNPIAMNSIFSTSFGLILMIALTLKKFSHELRYDDKSFLVLLVKAKTWVEFMKLFAFLLHKLYIECILCNVQR